MVLFFIFTNTRRERGAALMSSTASTLRCCRWWPSRSCPFSVPWQPTQSALCLKDVRLTLSGPAASSSQWTQVWTGHCRSVVCGNWLWLSVFCIPDSESAVARVVMPWAREKLTFVLLCKLCPSPWPLHWANCVLHHDLCVVQTEFFTMTFVLCKLCPSPWPLCCCTNCVLHHDLCVLCKLCPSLWPLCCANCPLPWPLCCVNCVFHYDLCPVQTVSLPWPLCCATCVLHHDLCIVQTVSFTMTFVLCKLFHRDLCVVQTVSFTVTFVLLLCRLCWPHRAAGQLEVHVPSHCHGGARLQPHCWDHPLCWRLWEHQGMAIVTACGLTGLCGNLRLWNDVFLLHFIPGTDNGWNVLPHYRLFQLHL